MVSRGWSSHAVRSNKWPTWPTTKGHHHVVHAKPKPLTGRKVWWFRGISWLCMGDSFGNKAISWYQLLHFFWLVTSTHAERYANTISCCREPDKLHLTLPTNVPKGLIAVFQGSCAATTLCHYSRRQGLPSRLRQTTQIWHTLNWKAKTSSIFFGQYWLSVMFSTSKQKTYLNILWNLSSFILLGWTPCFPCVSTSEAHTDPAGRFESARAMETPPIANGKTMGIWSELNVPSKKLATKHLQNV